MIQAEEHPGSVVGFRASRRQEIKFKSVSTLKPSLRSSIICSTLKPACSPAMANLPIALSNVDVAIFKLPRKNFFQRMARGSQGICDPNHTPL